MQQLMMVTMAELRGVGETALEMDGKGKTTVFPLDPGISVTSATQKMRRLIFCKVFCKEGQDLGSKTAFDIPLM